MEINSSPTELLVKKLETAVNSLSSAINSLSVENWSNTPDFILAEYLVDCLEAFSKATNARANWYGNVELSEKSDFLDVKVGMLARVKRHIWENYCLRHNSDYKENETIADFNPQPIVNVPVNKPYRGYVMLAYPFYWWKYDEIELVENDPT